MFHKIKKVKVLEEFKLKVEFINGIKKIYDMEKIINKMEEFYLLKNKQLFNEVKVDVGGLGISWNEDIDISSEELWENGQEIK